MVKQFIKYLLPSRRGILCFRQLQNFKNYFIKFDEQKTAKRVPFDLVEN